MGNNASCPADFDSEPFICRATCPAGFKFASDPNDPRKKRCVLFTDNSKFFDLKELPLIVPGPPGSDPVPEPEIYQQERNRVSTEAGKIKSMAPYQDNADGLSNQAEKIASQYAGFSALSNATQRIKDARDNIREPRPTVQPNAIESEKRKILNPLKMSVIQTALFTILLALAELLVVPIQYAQGLIFLTLCVGAAVGIYLSNT
jgi:hypothetical protein